VDDPPAPVAVVGACPCRGRADVPLEPVRTRDAEGRPAEALWCVACAAERRHERARRLSDYPGGPAWF
jgi:hypothetical protein